MVHRSLGAALVASLVALTASGGAQAEPKLKGPAAVVWQRFAAMLESTPSDLKDARFGFDLTGVHDDPVPAGALASAFDGGAGDEKLTVAFAANGEAAWVAVDLATYEICGDETCPRIPRVDERFHATALFAGGGPWQPVMWHVSNVLDSKAYAAAKVDDTLAPVPARANRADDVVALFRSSIGDPAALAKTVSTRADVVLYGTDRKERYVGGKKVAATLKKWNLGFTVKDGVAAGVTASGTVAWVAANVDAVSSKRPGAKPDPYRLSCIYEKTDAGWKLVNVHFSFPRY